LPCCSIADGFSILLTLNSEIKLEEELDLNKEIELKWMERGLNEW